jgi:hypothetical protein
MLSHSIFSSEIATIDTQFIDFPILDREIGREDHDAQVWSGKYK